MTAPSTTAPFWGIALAYWLHMLATAVWIGGLSALALLVLPSARRALDDSAYAVLLGELQGRLDALGWFSLAVLAVTGMIQMSANPNYQGFLAVNNRWAGAILLKHVTVLVMVGVSATITWGVLPRLRRNALRLSRSKASAGATDLEWVRQANQANIRLIWINLILSITVLAFTAAARAM